MGPSLSWDPHCHRTLIVIGPSLSWDPHCHGTLIVMGPWVLYLLDIVIINVS